MIKCEHNDESIALAIDELISLGYAVQNMVESLEIEEVEGLPKCIEDLYYRGVEMQGFSKLIKGEL